MNQKLAKIFKEMSQIDPEEKLVGLVLEKIVLERTKLARRKLIFSYLGLGSSLVGGISAIIGFGGAIAKSEFWSILSLAFSDAGIIAGYWQEYLYSLGETLPVLSLAIILIPVLGLIMSAGYFFDLKYKNKNFDNNFKLA